MRKKQFPEHIHASAVSNSPMRNRRVRMIFTYTSAVGIFPTTSMGVPTTTIWLAIRLEKPVGRFDQ
uniref:Uncharacterized protein n=1 Tax=Romanomermis culicivorax TaxID=13658 RepID=A0A915KFX0_ROMCU